MTFPYELLEKLNQAGYEAYVVGGAVRDKLLGVEPKDYDVATSAPMEGVEACFENTRRTGEKYGTVTVFLNNTSYEVTTFRKESNYDGRFPQTVSFVDSLYEDLSRRDFTINAMALDKNQKIYDFFQGQEDLKKGLLRFVGSPQNRIEEDRLRIFRLIRFAQRFQFEIVDTIDFPIDLSPLSFERIQMEFNEILCSKMPSKAIRKMVAYGLMDQIIPEIIPLIGFDQKTPYHHLDVFEHTLAVLDETSPDLEVRWAALLHDIGKPETFVLDELGTGHFYGHHRVSDNISQEILKRFKYDSKMIDSVCRMIHHHMFHYEQINESSIKRLIRKIGKEHMAHFLSLLKADRQGTKNPELSSYNQLEMMVKQVLSEPLVLKVTDLKINGHDLMAMGFEGPQVGRALNQLLEAVTDALIPNEKESLIAYVNQSLKR